MFDLPLRQTLQYIIIQGGYPRNIGFVDLGKMVFNGIE